MAKIYLFILSVCFLQVSSAQCPVINGALINACAADGVTEGINEFVYFTTGAAAPASMYKLSYGSRNPPASQNPTGILAGVDASAKTGPGTIIVQPGLTMIEITAAATVIPANSSVVLIPNNFDQAYDLSALCKNGTLYVVYININAATTIASKWMAGGTMANAATTLRYIQIEYNGNACTNNVRTYDCSLWPNPGNTPEAEGNSLAWTDQDSTLYLNNGCSVITPVKLVSFNAMQNGKDAQLSWATANELNTKEFMIEWSSDGAQFKTIGTLKASGNSDVLQHYTFLDRNVAAGNNFYRLKIIDLNGSYSYSPIVKLNVSGKTTFKVYPTLTTGSLTIEMTAAIREVTSALVYDQAGRLLFSKKITISGGYNRIELNVAQLPAGSYLLKIESNLDAVTTKFVKF
jgi:hypothetical protein